MAEIKHVGRLKANQRKVIVAYRVIPGDKEAESALVVDTASLADADHDTLIKTVESPAGQEAFEFAEVMARTTLSDGANMLARFHATNKLHKVKMSDVEMMPTPTYTIGLDELNKVIAEQRGTTIADLAMKDPNELPEGTTITEAGSVSNMPKTSPVQAEAQAALSFSGRCSLIFGHATNSTLHVCTGHFAHHGVKRSTRPTNRIPPIY